ncbi:MAG TPA: XrtA system polysaccharide deacetylase [Steroidobacteraceae bacterium]|jgi:polysaccharide deacetylase family protein (PEP-CTERM system associated)|nr:XrtA system polysaccharide deacetylase [Steroidobacteraceae bacterium]
MDELAATTAPGELTEQVNAFTVDVEDYFHVAALSSAVSRESWSLRESRVEANTERLMNVLAEHDVRATFFVLGWVAERIPTLVRRIADAGHEIACHGYSHRLVYTQTAAEFREETVRAKRSLEDTIGQAVAGYRAASFSVTRQSLWALDTLIDLGFSYDSSIFPIHHDLYGLPGATPAPHRVSAPSGRTLAEFPMSTAGLFGMQLPVSGGGYFRILPYWLTRAGLKQINTRRKRPFAFYLHPWELDPGQPRISVGPFSRFRHYTNLSRCEARLQRLLAEFSFTCMHEVLQQRGLLGAERSGFTRPLRPIATGPLVHGRQPAG